MIFYNALLTSILSILFTVPSLFGENERQDIGDETICSVEPVNGWLFNGKDKVLPIQTNGNLEDRIKIDVAFISDVSLMLDNKDTILVQHASVTPGKTAHIKLSSLQPGFYQVRISCSCGGLEDSIEPFNIGIDPTEIVCPEDVDTQEFDAFWDNTLEQLAAIPMCTRMEVIPELSNNVRTSYRVYFKSWGGETAGGIACIPNKPGKYPAYIKYNGYGGIPIDRFDPDSYPDRIQFSVCVRGQGIFHEKEERWIDRGLDSKENFYYRGAYCDVVRAIDFVCSLPGTDGERLYAYGESQGGAFSFISAALDPRIKAIAPAVPFMGDFANYWKIVSWPMWEIFETAQNEGLDRNKVLDVLKWFDTKNFAHRINCPLKMSFGLQDDTCPPRTNFAPYNLAKGEKSYSVFPKCAHGMWREKDWDIQREDFFNSISTGGNRMEDCTSIIEYNGYPTVFAHRGCWVGNIQNPGEVQEYLVPENSTDGIKMAARMGYPSIELDVRWTLDSALVCMHDYYINRTMRLAEGYAEIPTNVAVCENNFNDLRTRYVLTSCNPDMRKPIPTLGEMLRTCAGNGIVPLMHCDIFEGYELAKAIVGDNFICFTGDFGVCKRTRAISSCLILFDPRRELEARGLETTPKNILALLDEIGGNTGISSMSYSICDKDMIGAMHAHGHVVQSSIFPTPYEMTAVRNGADILLSDFCWRPAKGMKACRKIRLNSRNGSTSHASGDPMELGAIMLTVRGNGTCTVCVNGEREYRIDSEGGNEACNRLSLRFWNTSPSISISSTEGSRFKVRASVYQL